MTTRTTSQRRQLRVNQTTRNRRALLERASTLVTTKRETMKARTAITMIRTRHSQSSRQTLLTANLDHRSQSTRIQSLLPTTRPHLQDRLIPRSITPINHRLMPAVTIRQVPRPARSFLPSSFQSSSSSHSEPSRSGSFAADGGLGYRRVQSGEWRTRTTRPEEGTGVRIR